MSRCDPLNTFQLKRYGASQLRQQNEDVSSSGSESELDYLLNLVIDGTEGDRASDSFESSEEEDQTIFDKLTSLLPLTRDKSMRTKTSKKIIISDERSIHSSEENTTDQGGSRPHLQNGNISPNDSHKDKPLSHTPVIIKVEPGSPEQEVSTHAKSTREPICVPTSKNWEGPHNFRIKVCLVDSKKPTYNPIYCKFKNKLYISKDYEFRILFKAKNVPAGSVIKATAFYTNVSDVFEVVKRCPVHVQEDKEAGKLAVEHVLQSSHSQATYEQNEKNGRYSVVIPYQESEEECVSSAYKFVCWGSCIGGLNRRPFMIHFTLENKGILLARQVLHIKVCACPSRDLRIETEKDLQSQQLSPTSDLSDTNSMDVQNSAQNYTINTRDHKLYKFLNQMKSLYETSAQAEYLLQFDLLLG